MSKEAMRLAIREFKPNHNMTFHNQDGKQIGVLDFNGPEMTFTGDADESAKLFFDLIARSFKGRLEQERADERAQRLWVELTEEDKTELRRKHYPLPLLLMEATEAKLKEKNT